MMVQSLINIIYLRMEIMNINALGNTTDTSAHSAFQNLYSDNKFDHSNQCPTPDLKSLFSHANDPVLFFEQLDSNQKRDLFPQLNKNQRAQVASAYFKSDSFAHQLLLTGESPSIEKANEFFKKWKSSSTIIQKELNYSYQFAASDLQTNCSGQEILASLCLATKLKAAFLTCTEKSTASSMFAKSSYGELESFDNKSPRDCSITLTGPQFTGGFQQEKFSQTMQSMDKAFLRTLPLLDGKKITSANQLSLQNLLSTQAPGSSLAATLNVNAQSPAQTVREILNPMLGENGLPPIAEQDFPTINIKAHFKQTISPKAQLSQSRYELTNPKNLAWNQQLALTTNFATNVTKIEASNYNILDNYIKSFKPVGMSFQKDDFGLKIGNLEAFNKPQETTSWNFVPDMNVGRAGEIVVKILTPAAIGITFANESAKFCQKVFSHPKKTPGQKVAGCVVGATGVLAGLGLAFERLSNLNLSIQ